MAKKPRKHKKLQNTRAILNQARYGTSDPEKIMELDVSGDEKFLRRANIRWDEIEEIDRNLVIQSTRVAGELLPIIENPDVINNLGDRKELFMRAAVQFKNDFIKFTEGLEAIKDRWEGKQGQVLTMEDLNLYNIISTEYNELNSKFLSFSQLTAATITVEGMEAVNKAAKKQRDEDNNIEEGDFTEIDDDLKNARAGVMLVDKETLDA